MKNFTNPGTNHTGMATSPIHARAMLDIADYTEPPESDETVQSVRIEYAREAEPISTMPPPGSLKELVKVAGKLLKNEKATVLVDKLGERLAFERMGVRLYEGVLTKFDAFGTWRGGPTREQLEEIHDDELAHFHLLREAMGSLGADFTAMTPSANLVATISMGLPTVICDPRTDLRQALQAVLVAELADNAAWETLILGAHAFDLDLWADKFEAALDSEQRHLRRVRAWLGAALSEDARGEPTMNGQVPRGLGVRGRVARRKPVASAKLGRGNGKRQR